jgi:DNA polymerase-3 subunit gamma/tau
MFENIIGQDAAAQLGRDILEGKLAPSMLFVGPSCAGKGSAALELARILSCERNNPPAETSPWNCNCPSCCLHRTLSHHDLLVMGPRFFAGEIAAARSAMLRTPASKAGGLLFIRALKKLTIRFNPILWEDDPKLPKINPVLQPLNEGIDSFIGCWEKGEFTDNADGLKKISQDLVDLAQKLENEGAAEAMPVGRIRKAAYWTRLAPEGRHKVLVIEQAELMQEGARNSLLKLLEEPPPQVSIILTALREKSLLPTILSRLRPYRFAGRSLSQEVDVIRRIFKDTADNSGTETAANSAILSYLESFLPVKPSELYPLAAYTAASAAAQGLKKGRRPLAAAQVIGAYAAPLAEAAGLGRPAADMKAALEELFKRTGNFSVRSLYPRFLQYLLDVLSCAFKGKPLGTEELAVRNFWSAKTNEAATAAGIYNITPVMATEKLFTELRDNLGG